MCDAYPGYQVWNWFSGHCVHSKCQNAHNSGWNWLLLLSLPCSYSYSVFSAAIQQVKQVLRHSILAIWIVNANFTLTKVARNGGQGFVRCILITDVFQIIEGHTSNFYCNSDKFMYDCFSPSPLLPGVMHKLSQLCGDIEDGGTKYASVLHPWSQVSGTGETQIIITHY